MFIHDIIKIEYIRQGYLPDFPYHLISDKEMFNAFIVDEIRISQTDATQIKYGKQSLWEAPKYYVNLYELASFEYVTDSHGQSLLIKGRRAKLSEFSAMCGSLATNLSNDCYFAMNYPLLHNQFQKEYDELVDAIYYHIEAHLASTNSVEMYQVPDWIYSYMNGSVVGVNSSDLDIHDFLSLMNLDNIKGEFTKEVYESCIDISKSWVSKLPPTKKVKRPCTMYGEPHVIKSLRISGLVMDEG